MSNRPPPPLPACLSLRPGAVTKADGADNRAAWARAQRAADAMLQSAARLFVAVTERPSNRHPALAEQALREAAAALIVTNQAHITAALSGYGFGPADVEGLPASIHVDALPDAARSAR